MQQPNQQSWYNYQQQLAQQQQQQQQQPGAQPTPTPTYTPRPVVQQAPAFGTNLGGSFTGSPSFAFQTPAAQVPQMPPTLQQQLNQFPQIGQRPPSTTPSPFTTLQPAQQQEVAKPKQVVVKLYLEPGNHIRRFTLSSLDVTLDQFLNGKVKTIVDKKKKFNAAGAKRVYHYKDDEDEWVRIEDEDEWQECLRLVKYQQTNKEDKKSAALLKFRITASAAPLLDKGKGPLVDAPMVDVVPTSPPQPIPSLFQPVQPVHQSPAPQSPFPGIPQSSQPTAPAPATAPAVPAPTVQPPALGSSPQYKCDSCSDPIADLRHHCMQCTDYDLCRKCFDNRFAFHDPSHSFDVYDNQDHLVSSAQKPAPPQLAQIPTQQPVPPQFQFPGFQQPQPQAPQQFPGFGSFNQSPVMLFGAQPPQQPPQAPIAQDPALEQFMTAARTMGLDESKMRPLFDKHKGNFEAAVHDYLNYN